MLEISQRPASSPCCANFATSFRPIWCQRDALQIRPIQKPKPNAIKRTAPTGSKIIYFIELVFSSATASTARRHFGLPVIFLIRSRESRIFPGSTNISFPIGKTPLSCWLLEASRLALMSVIQACQQCTNKELYAYDRSVIVQFVSRNYTERNNMKTREVITV